MKIIANGYYEKDIIKFLRQGTELNQKDFGKSIVLSGMTIQNYERGVRNFPFKIFMKIVKTHDYIVTIEKRNNN